MADTTHRAQRSSDQGVTSSNGLIWSSPFAIELGWLDANGHLNMAYYHVMFDRTVDIAFDALGLGETYREAERASVFNVETHVLYRREVQAHDEVRASFQLLGSDEKRLHAYQTMLRAGDGELVATSESLFVHVSLEERSALAFPDRVRERAEAMVAAHAAAELPRYAGRRIAPLAPIAPTSSSAAR